MPDHTDIPALLAELYPDPAHRRLWLRRPQPLLNGAVPTVLIRSGKGAEVALLLRQLREMVYV